MPIKTTVFNEIHHALKAKMLPFAGFEMPIVYRSILDEHHAVREAAGLFDVSHMGEFFIEGPQALQAVQWISSNDAAKLAIGQVQYACLPNETGGIVDDLLVYKLADDRYLLVVNGANIRKDYAWIEAQIERFDATLTDRSDDYALLAVQGPRAVEIVQTLTETDLSGIPYYRFKTADVAGVADVIVSATGYTGAGGFELYIPEAAGPKLWHALMQAGQTLGLQPAGLAARDTLRLEMGYCLYGNEIDETTSPLEAGLGWITKLNKGEFVGRDFLLRQREAGLARRLVGFELIDRGVARNGYELTDESGRVIGRVTSGTQSPTLGKAIGLGYVPTTHRSVGSRVFVRIRKKLAEACVVALPFVKKATASV